MEFKVYNTLSKRVEEFSEIEEEKVKMYTCGLTVYNFAHIGNLRTYIFEDVLKKVLEYEGFEVTHVMNITDVGHLQSDEDVGEDKMAIGAKRENKSVLEIARFYEDSFMKDLQRLNIKAPTIKARATEHIEDMINLIKILEGKGYTYIANAFTVLFDVLKNSNLNNIGKKALIEDFDRIFSLDLIEQKENKLDSEKINFIEKLLKERECARKNKDWAKSDEIRDKLLKEDIEIVDTKEGTKWKFKE